MLYKKLRDKFAERQIDVHNEEKIDDQKQMDIQKDG